MTSEADNDGIVSGINVTPLVDIMLVLLIVFMVTAHFVADSGLKINLPKAASADGAATPSLTVSLNQNGEIFLLERKVDSNGLKANLEREAKLNPGVRVMLAADQTLPYRDIVAMLDLVKQAGVTRVALASEE